MSASGCAIRILLLAAGLLAPIAAGAEVWGDWRLRGDFVDDIPGGRSLDRGRLHGYLGWRSLGEGWEFGLAAKLAGGTDSNSDAAANLDNEESDTIELGELYWRRRLGASNWLLAGQTSLPLWLSPLVWDGDFRPAGVALLGERELRVFDVLEWSIFYGSPHHIDEHASRLAAAQLAWWIRDGAPKGGAVVLSYLNFSDLDGLVTDRRTRTNLVAAGSLVNDFRLLDLQLQYRFPMLGTSLQLEANAVTNLDADEADRGYRFSARLGDGWQRGAWEFGLAWHRIQREAVMAAFNEDDWWFPSAMRGVSPWLAYGLGEGLRLRVAGFHERRDGLDQHLDRVLIDLNWRF